MELSERIQQDLVAAMKARAELQLATLRMMKTAVKNLQIELGRAPTDAEVQQVLGTLIKQRQDSAQQFLDGGRAELAEREKAEIVVIEGYLPRALSLADIEQTVRETIASTGASSPGDMGMVMKSAMAHFQARQQRVDGKQVSETVKRLLSAGKP